MTCCQLDTLETASEAFTRGFNDARADRPSDPGDGEGLEFAIRRYQYRLGYTEGSNATPVPGPGNI